MSKQPEPPSVPSAAAVAWSALLAALDELELNAQADHPDETVQWAINELSDEGHAYVFGGRRKVLDAYKEWKAAKPRRESDESKT